MISMSQDEHPGLRPTIAMQRSTKFFAKLQDSAVVDALGDYAVRKRFTDLGQEIFPRDQQTPEALAAYHKAEIDKWWPIVKEAGIKPK
jgi:tripartite-type tricarboxylate transporter receptor subunit TctC